MLLEKDKYYHLYNRSNNNEAVFKVEENYAYFLKKYFTCCNSLFYTIAYCLMPTHFHFIVRCEVDNATYIRKSVGLLLSSYTKAIIKGFARHGSLFQPRTKAKEITDETYLATLISYVHQNPIRANLVRRLEDWPYSSYCGFIGMSKEEWIQFGLLSSLFKTPQEFQSFSEQMIQSIRSEVWV